MIAWDDDEGKVSGSERPMQERGARPGPRREKERGAMIGQIRCRTCGTGDGDCLTASVVDGQRCCQECEHRRRWVDEDVQVAQHGHLEGWRVAFALFVVAAALLFALTDPFVWSGKDMVATVAIVTVIAWAIR